MEIFEDLSIAMHEALLLVIAICRVIWKNVISLPITPLTRLPYYLVSKLYNSFTSICDCQSVISPCPPTCLAAMARLAAI